MLLRRDAWPCVQAFLLGLFILLMHRIQSPGSKSASHSMAYGIAAHSVRQQAVLFTSSFAGFCAIFVSSQAALELPIQL
ncbi:MAG: hypothetical protein EAZ11_09330 [Curvibacter sp.]|nr:MAG: hypothetical protein EAZ11_09330 [Curvibacter sp.]